MYEGSWSPLKDKGYLADEVILIWYYRHRSAEKKPWSPMRNMVVSHWHNDIIIVLLLASD
jgi:hypothetical protein